MKLAILFVLGALYSGASVQAQVTGVITESTAELVFRPDVSGRNIRANYNGTVLEDSFGSTAFGSGASFASTSQVGPGIIEFKNGNASTGAYTYSTSRTAVDISFTNDGTETVRPSLRSTIVPAGLGLFVGGDCQGNVTACGIDDVFPGDFRTFDSFGGSSLAPVTDAIAGASFTFRIIGDGLTIYELAGSVTLAGNPGGGLNILSSDLGAASAALDGFTQISTPGSRSEFGFAWGETSIDVDFAPGTLLAPGEGATLTYETIVQTYSRAQCFGQLTAACVVAYSSFGDPVGRGGSPQINRASRLPINAAQSTEISFDSFAFRAPVFANGNLSFLLRPAIPEPETWTMMILGFALSGAMMRTSRRIALHSR